MVLKFYGTYETLPTQIELARKVGSESYYYNGLPQYMLKSWEWILSDVGKLDADPDYGILSEGLTFDKVKADINLNRPIIALYATDLWILNWEILTGPIQPYHAVVIVGYDDAVGESNDKVLIYDPWPPYEGTIQNRKWADVQQELWFFCNAIRTRPQVKEGIVITLQETQHKLYLHVYDDQGHHVGLNYDTNIVDLDVAGSEYDDYNGTIAVHLPPDVKSFRYVVDASSAEEKIESYSITVKELHNETVTMTTTTSDTIAQGETEEYAVQVLPEEIFVNTVKEAWWLSPVMGIPTYAILISVIAIVAISVSLLLLRRRKLNIARKSNLGK